MSIEEFPQINPKLVEALDKLFPDACPRIDTPDREVWAAVGTRKVIALLKARLSIQEERSVTDSLTSRR